METVNYEDAMAISGRAPVIRQFPPISGIDFSGVVETSAHAGFAVGDRVVAHSWGLSQTHHGGFAQKARVSGDWLVKLPDAFSTRDAMAIGTAGDTAMLSVVALEHAGATPDKGEALATEAGRGAGSIAIALLSGLGYRDSVNAPQEVRPQAWARLATDLDPAKLARATQGVGLAAAPGLAGPVLLGQVRGRTVVDVNA